MDKNSFLKRINFDDKTLLSNLFDKINLASRINSCIFTNEFYPPILWKTLEDIGPELDINVNSYGIFDDAERRVISFSSDIVYHYPVKLLRIKNKSRFANLEHRDYLGAITSLGIKREKFGDLILQDDCGYIAVMEDVESFIIDNLDRIGKCPCIVESIEDLEQIPHYNYKEIIVPCTSYRADCIVGSIAGVSRSKASELLSSGKVMVDYLNVIQKDKIISLGSVITIRGTGKFKLTDEVGATGSGRLKLLVKKYI